MVSPADFIVKSSVSLSRSIIKPSGPFKKPFTIAGYPMSVTAGVSGSLGLSANYEGSKADVYQQGQPCWTFTMGFMPSLDLKAVVALNALEIGFAQAGLSVDLTLVGVAFPVHWTFTESSVVDATTGKEKLTLDVDAGADFRLRTLAGKIAAFLQVSLPLGIKLEVQLQPVRLARLLQRLASGRLHVHGVPRDDLTAVIRQQATGP